MTRVDVLEALTNDERLSVLRARARVDLAAIERNCARLAPPPRRRSCAPS